MKKIMKVLFNLFKKKDVVEDVLEEIIEEEISY